MTTYFLAIATLFQGSIPPLYSPVNSRLTGYEAELSGINPSKADNKHDGLGYVINELVLTGFSYPRGLWSDLLAAGCR